MKLKYQLFIVLLIASALLIALMLAINNVSFQRQFITYVNSTEIKRLEPLVKELSDRFTTEGDWQWINKTEWAELQRRHSVMHKSGQLRPPPRKKKSSDETGSKRRTSRKHPTPWLTLANRNRSVVIGPPPKPGRMKWLKISSDNDTAGYVGFVRHEQFSREIDKEFARQQRRNFFYAALAMVALCALIAAPLASRIIRPLNSVNKAIGELSGGNFHYRTDIDSRDEFGEVAKNINRLGTTLEQNKAARQRWIAEISHELRTPVGVLQGEIEAIQDGIRTANTETIASLHAEIIRLSRLIDDLHQLSVSDLGALDYRMVTLDLGTLLAEFLESHTKNLNVASIALTHTHQSLLVQADQERIVQLLENLMQNTLRYTSAPGTLNVSVTRESGKIIVLWSDSSPGVSDEDLAHLFEPLYRAEKSRSRQTSGSGLGLSIVQKIVEAHGGDISATHSDQGGLSVRLSLPEYT